MKTVKFGNFRNNCNFANSVKSHICRVKNSRLALDLRKRQNDFAEDIFLRNIAFVKCCENAKALLHYCSHICTTE